MLKILLPLAFLSLLSGCQSISSAYLPKPTGQTDTQVIQMQSNIQALEDADYQRNRKKRQEAIEDIGTLYTKEAEAVNKANENLNNANIYILH